MEQSELSRYLEEEARDSYAYIIQSLGAIRDALKKVESIDRNDWKNGKNSAKAYMVLSKIETRCMTMRSSIERYQVAINAMERAKTDEQNRVRRMDEKVFDEDE